MLHKHAMVLFYKNRAMFLQSGFSQKFWGKADLCAWYGANIISIRAFDKEKAFEILFCRMPNVNKLRVFDCFVHIHLLSKLWSCNLASRSRSGILLGFENGVYRICDVPQSRYVKKNIRILMNLYIHRTVTMWRVFIMLMRRANPPFTLIWSGFLM